MKKLSSKMLISALALFTLVGCNSVGYQDKAKQPTALSNQTALAIISQESQKALHAQQLLTKYAKHDAEMLAIRQADFDNDKIALNYIGKPDALLNSIAIKYGYRYIPVGDKRELPTINFNKYYTTPKDALALIDAQLNNTANIYLNKEQKLITLTYQK